MRAAPSEHAAMVMLLLDRGANIDLTDKVEDALSVRPVLCRVCLRDEGNFKREDQESGMKNRSIIDKCN